MCFFSLERKRSPFNWTTNPLHKHLQITICSNEIKLKPFIELSKPFIHCGRYIIYTHNILIVHKQITGLSTHSDERQPKYTFKVEPIFFYIMKIHC